MASSAQVVCSVDSVATEGGGSDESSSAASAPTVRTTEPRSAVATPGATGGGTPGPVPGADAPGAPPDVVAGTHWAGRSRRRCRIGGIELHGRVGLTFPEHFLQNPGDAFAVPLVDHAPVFFYKGKLGIPHLLGHIHGILLGPDRLCIGLALVLALGFPPVQIS